MFFVVWIVSREMTPILRPEHFRFGFLFSGFLWYNNFAAINLSNHSNHYEKLSSIHNKEKHTLYSHFCDSWVYRLTDSGSATGRIES